MKKLTGLKIAVCQMHVASGLPSHNTKYIINEIYNASKRGVDVIVFPELCISGYLIGDKYEDNGFINDLQTCHEQIREATKGLNTIVIFGSVTCDKTKVGENGRIRKFNSALIAQDGKWLGVTNKSLLPDYRIFHDTRHFYSTRYIRDEHNEKNRTSKGLLGVNWLGIHNYLKPLTVKTRIGEIKIGASLCEDMWDIDYPFKPIRSLASNGAEIIFNLSASPWTWRKNRKRHEVVKNLLGDCRVPFVYVNNTGVQIEGGNVVVFDGSSAVYDQDGNIVFEVSSYDKGSRDFTFSDKMLPVKTKPRTDTVELYAALKCSAQGFLDTLALSMRKVVIGLSGGVDSAVSAAFYTRILGPENVFAFNMPYKDFNKQVTKDIARKTAENLGIEYKVIPIDEAVDINARLTGVEPGTLAHQNIQSRARMEILAAEAQKIGGVFSANCNKVELAFGYGTLYGDLAGFFMLLGDLVKREVYQIGDYLNKFVYEREVIPKECFEIAPSAETKKSQEDPFDYGNLDYRGYHDEMVRAFTEFRRSPEWFLKLYANGKLEKELLLKEETLARLFPTSRHFIKDLESKWRMFHGFYFKRKQGTFIPIVSKRAFGGDLIEAILPAHLTQRYHDMKRFMLSQYKPKERIVIFGGSFNPSGKNHIQIAKRLSESFNKVIIVPCGERSDKPSANIIPIVYRKEMIKMAFEGMAKVEIDLYDLENNVYTPTYLLQERYAKLFPNAEIWHFVGGDIVTGGRNEKSEIHHVWEKGNEIWQNLNFLVIHRPGYKVEPEDMPPFSEFIEIKNFYGSGTMIRKRIKAGEPINDLVIPEIAEYIKKHKLYL